MTEKQNRAAELKNRTGDAHYNCCQAVACVFADETGINEDTLRKLGAGFGMGMGTTEATCGALCGAEMILGLMKYNGKPIRKDAAELYNAFKEKCGGAAICRDIKGVGTGKVLCSCDDCVRNAVSLLEDVI
ncbi:MAG: C_GCAxxG_C_C family protein [Synergistaceae bacterium]|nr:C_GCAxxG_C_C family protein [Synergistaceae bacterium]MBQ3449121.1 C_GCAxxG_C_C family protein [Synergistaceae bacterium]MBQ3694128.1 C_GCAxxG_C_C family protein [Synergistaceae bacterium]MBQ6110992.1 C_GCAxxG_C_C family protein [Synergistaceae bacterium]MBQ9628661.1 C_GCAxxG_C_C family protein [Synergistaceae bacterium]